jgi:hypothetical protein
MKIFKETLEHTFMAMCHDPDAPLDELMRRLAMYREINPLGPDVSITMHTYIFSTSDGRLPLSTVDHLENMVRRVVKLYAICKNVERISGVLEKNLFELNKIRSMLMGVSVEQLPAFPPNDYSDRVARTRALLEAMRAAVDSHDKPEPPAAQTTDFTYIFDHDRFFFLGKYPEPFALEDLGEIIVDLLHMKFSPEDVDEFVSSGQMDQIIGTIECVAKFYNALFEQIERVIEFAKSMFNSYSMPNTAPIFAAPTPVTSLSRSTRTFDHVRVPPGSVRAGAAGAGDAGAGAGGASDEEDEDSSEPVRKRRTPHRKRLPPPLGLEPAGATTISPTGKKLFPKPHVITMASILMRVVEHYGLTGTGGSGELTGLIGRLPPTNIVRARLEEFMQADMRDRYYPALAKILVNYSHDMKLKRITDTGQHHQDLLRMLYLEEHQRITSGGAKPSFEELVDSKPDLTPLDSMFTLEELQENLLNV